MRLRFVFAAMLAMLAFASDVSGEGRAFIVIVHPSNPTNSASRELVADAFLKKTTQWPSGGIIRPVDLTPRSPTRRQFSEEVLHRSISEVRGYWQQRIFSGRDVPPPELESDDDVIRFVLDHEGGVGYVSGAAALRGAKPLGVQ